MSGVPPPAGHYEEGRFSALASPFRSETYLPLYKGSLQCQGFCSCNIRGRSPRRQLDNKQQTNDYLIQYMNNIRHNNLYIMRKRLTLLQWRRSHSIPMTTLCMCALLWVICLMFSGWLSCADKLWSTNVIGGLRQRSYRAALSHCR